MTVKKKEPRTKKKESGKKSTSIALQKKGETAVGIFQGNGPSGFEGTDAQTFKTPFVRILQALSDEVKKSKPSYVEGAEEGMFYNTATGEVTDSLDVIVLKIEDVLIAWKPDRGGFVGRYAKTEEKNIVDRIEGMKKWDEQGNEIMDTLEFYCATPEGDIFILALSSSARKHGRSFATRLRMLKHEGKPVNVSWAAVWTLSTREETNDKGSWSTLASPVMDRIVTIDEIKNIIKPAISMLATAETDYNQVSENGEEEDDEY